MNKQENQHVEKLVATPAGLRQIKNSIVYSMNTSISEGRLWRFDSVLESYRLPLTFGGSHDRN